MQPDLKPHGAVGVESVCLTLAGIFVVLRVYVQAYILRKLSASDFLIVAAWLLFLSNTICDIYSNKYGMWNPKIRFTSTNLPDFDVVFPDKRMLVKVLKILYFSTPLYYLALYLIKAAIILLYFRLFPPDHIKLRRALYFTTGFTALGCVLMLCFNLFWCLPVWRNWSTSSPDRCLAVASVPTYLITAAFHLMSDLMIYALPFFLIRTLAATTSRRRLAGIFAIFGLGFICIAITIARIILVVLAASFPLIGSTSASEMAAGIIVACCPPLKWFWSSRMEHIRKSGGSGGICCVTVGMGSGGRSKGSRSGDNRQGGSVRGTRGGLDTRNVREVGNEKMMGKLRSTFFTKKSRFNRTRTTRFSTNFGEKTKVTSPDWTATNTAGTEGTLSVETLDEDRSLSISGLGTVTETRTGVLFGGGLAPRERSLSVDMPPAQHGGVGVGSGWRKWLGIGSADEPAPGSDNADKRKRLSRGELGLSTFGGRKTRTNGGGGAGVNTMIAGASTVADREWEREHGHGKSMEERERDRVREMLHITPQGATAANINDAELGLASRVHIRIHAAHDFNRNCNDDAESDADTTDTPIPRGLGRGSFYADDETMEEYRPRRIQCMFEQQREEEQDGDDDGECQIQQPQRAKHLLKKQGGPIGSDFGGGTFLTGPSSPGSASSLNGYESANYGSSIFGSSV